MGNTPAVTLDFSTFQALPKATAQPGAFQTRPGAPIQNANAVKLDMSTFQPIAGPGEQIGYSGLKDIVPLPGEDFADTMKRAIAYGKTLSPADLQRQTQADLKVAPAVVAAAPVIGAAGAAGIAGAAALFGPETTAAAARDALGRFTGGTVEQAGASLATQLIKTYGPPDVSWLAQHAVKSAVTGAVGGATWALIDHLMKKTGP